MWKAAFTGRSEKGGDRERDSASVVGRSDARRKKSSRSSRGDVDDTASMVSGTSRRHRSSRHESSSRYGDDDDDGRVKSSSRHGDEDRDRMRDSSSYYSGPPSVYGSAASYASPASGSYATSPTSRVSGETRALTASALRMLPDEDEGDEDAWEDDEKTVKSERRKKRRSSSDEREKRRKSTGKEKERKRSSSRERKEKKRSSTAEKSKEKASSSSRRSEPKLVAESSRAIPAMGSFEQFPGQYNGGVMGQPQQDYTMSGALPNVVPSAQFPGQDVPVPDQQPAPPMGISRADSYGHAADYYMDEGQSVAHQPGNRASTPNMLVNPQHHLVAASAVPVPAQDTGNGSAADYFNNNNVSYSAPVTPARPTAKPSKQSSSSASKPSKSSSKLSKPSRTSSGSAVAAGLTGVAAASALSGFGNGKASSSHRHSQSEYSTSSSYQQQPSSGRSDYPPTLPAMTSQSRPSRQSDGSIYYAVPANGAGPSLIGSSAYGPNYENTYGTGNVQGKTTNHSNAGMYAAGAAAAGAAAYGIYQHQHGRTDSNTAVAGGFGGGGQGPPPPGSFGAGSYYPSSGSGGGMMQQGHFHEHKGPMTKLKDGLLNLISTPEDVAKMEMYTEYIGVCKYCFDPRTSAWDAPRVHHYHKRRDSFESLRRRASRNKLQRKGSNERVDKESRYDASDSSRRRREERHSGMGLPGAGLAAVGTGLAANALFNHRNNFDDTYSVQSGHRESSAMRRRSRSSSREKRRQSQHGTIRPCGDEFRNVTIRRKDGTIEHRRVARSRSGSGDRESGFGLGTAAAAGAALGAASLAASVRRRSRSSSRERKRHSGRTSDGRSDYSRYESDGRRQSAEGGGGIFGNFFSPPRKSRRGSREHQKKRAGFFTFSNDSASSANSDLAFGGSALSRKTSKSSLSRRSSNRSTRGRLRQKSSDQQLAATLAGIGATAAALSAAKAGHRISKRTSRPELGARRQVRQQVVGDHRQGSPGSSEEEGWEDELPSDDASSNDGLAFGDYGGKRLSGRQSLESVASQSSAGGLGAWGWRWGGKDKKRKSRRSTSGEVPYPTTEYGSAVGPIAAGIAGGGAGAAASSAFDASRPVHPDKTVYLDDSGRPLPTVDSRSSVSGHSSQPLQLIDPQPLSETGTPRQQSVAGGFTTPTRVQYMPGAFETDEPPIYRPGPGVVQHPQPMSPARPAFTQAGAEAGYTATAGAANGRPAPRRSQSSPVPSSWGQDAALIGAGVLGAGAIIAGSALSSGRKSKDSPANVRFGLTEEQQRREKRSDKQDDKRADEERRRADRTRALKEEAKRAAKKSSEQEVLRAREAENRARAQAQLDLQREQERKEAEEARIRAEQQAREEREQRAEIERLERAAAERQAAAASAAAEFERQRKAREEAERRQAEVERQNREREEALRRQQYELAEEARREDEQRRQWEAERYAREYQQSARRASGREPFESPRGRSDDGKQSSGWSTVAAGAAAAAGVGAVIATRDGKKRRQSGKSDSTEESPISRRPPRTSVDWNADAFTDERDAAEQAELDRQAREQYGYASRGNVERKDGYAATEIKPGGAEEGEPIMDDDIFDPDFFMRSQHTPADRAKHEELARKAADKVVADRARAYSPDSRPKENYADFFADEVKDMLAKKPGEKERNIQPDSDVQVYHVEEYGATPPFALRNDLGGKSKHAPYGVPRLNVIAPTPPPGSKTTSTKGSVPSSPLSKAVDGGAEHSPDSAKDSGKSDRSRSISWGEDEVNVYDVQTPESFQEKDRDSYITSPDLRKAGNGVAAAAGVAGAATVGSALHDIVVEDGNNTKSYKEEEFSPASSKKGKKDKKKAKKGFKSNADDADASFLDELSDKAKKSSSFEDVPPERGTEAPYQETDFSRTRKDKKPDSSKEADIEEVARTPDAANSGSLPNPLYQQPFFDSVSDFSGFRRDSPGTEGAPPVRGFIEGETDEPTPKDEKKPHIPGGFDDDERDTVAGAVAEEPAFEPQLSKKEKKRREKGAKRVGSGTLDASEPSTPVNEREESIPEIPLSAKERKKLEKEAKRTSSGSFVESDAVVAEEATIEPPLSSKERKKREKETKRASVSFDTEPSTPAATREPEADDWEPPLSAKERKKREKAAKKAGIDPAYSEDPTPIVESPRAAETEATEYFPSTSKEEAAQNKQFEDGLRRIASTTSAVSLPSWSGDTVVSDVTAKPPSPELSRSEQKRAEKQAKKSGFSFADVTDTILASGGVVAAAAALNESAEDSTSGSSKKDKKKRKSKLGEASFDDPRDGPAIMPGGWDSPERKSSPESSETVKEDTVDPFDTKSRETGLPKSVAANETPVPQEPEPSNDWFEPASSKKSKKKSKRSSVAFDSTPQVSSPLRSEVAWDDYIGTNGHDKAESEAARSDPITVIERKADDDVKSSRKSSTQDEFFDAGPRISESPRDMSPEDARSAASSGDADRESRRKSRREEARRASDYYDQPEYAYEAQSTISSEPADEEGRKKHKRRSRHEDDDTMSVSSSRRRSRHGDDDGDTRSVTSSRSRRDKEESPTQKKEKKGIFGSLFGRKSSESKEASRDTKQDDDDEELRRRKKKHRDSEYGDEEDDTKSVRSESHRRRHRSSDGKDDNDSRERRRRSTHEDDDKYSESGTRHHRRRRTDESGESLSRHRSHDSKSEHGDRPKHHRRRTDEDSYDTTRDQSFLGSRVEDLPPLPASRPDSPDTAVERMEGRPLEAASGTGLVSAAAAAAVGVAAGVAASAVSKKKRGGKGQEERNDEPDDIGVERAVEKAEYDGPLPSAAAHSFPLPYVPENKEMRLVGDEGVGVSSPNPPVLEQPARPVSVGRPGSSTAVPLRLPGHAPNTPGGKERAKSFSSPMAAASSSSLASPATPGSGKSRQSRPHSSDLKSGIMPLYLVERSRPVQEVEDSLPSLPSSKPSSRASSVHGSDEYESAREDFSVASSPARSRTRSLTLDTISANNFRSDEDILDSQQTTPKASEWPQTAIPWALPVAASGEKREKQQPQFYTWEDFAQDERMHEEERHADAAAEQSRDMSLPAESSISSSASPSKAKTLAAAAMLGTAAVYSTRKGKDRSPERVEELNAQAPPPSAAAHSFPLPYIPQATLENVVPEVETTAKLQEAFEPISSAKNSKKKGKKGKKQQASGVATPEETMTVESTAGEQRHTGIAAEAEVVAEAVSSEDVENTAKAVDAQHDVVFPSAAAHTLPIVPVVDFPESRPELSRSGEEQALSQPSDAGYFTSAAVLSMPVYERPTEPVRNNEDKVSASSSYKLPELKAEPAPLVLEQRSVVVEPAAMVEVPEAPKLTRKQSKKDKKKAKRTSIFEDEPRGQIDEFAGPDVPPTVASAKDVEAEATPVPVNFGLSDFGAVAAGAVTLWGLSQANAFQASMQNVRASKSESSEGNAVVPDAAPNEGSREIDDDRPAMATQDVFAPISSKKKSKKEKRKTKQTAALDDAPEAQADPVETADVAEPIAVAEAPQELPALGNEPSDVQKDFELEHDAWAAIPVRSKQSKGDNKNRRSAAAAAVEDEVEIAQPGVDAQQVALGIDAVREAREVPEIQADAPWASDIAEATPTADVPNELPADGSEVQIEQKGVEPEANEWATPITSKQSRKDKKKRRSAATVEIQDEMTQPEVDAQQGTVDNEPVTATSIVPALLPADAEQSAVVVPAATKELAPEAENSEEMFPVTPKKGKKSKKHRKSLQQDESESGTPVKDEQQVQADTVDTADDAERSLEPETVQLSVEEAAVDRDAPASGVTAVVEDLAPVSSKKKSKKDKRKSKTIALEEAEKPSEIIANDEGAAAKPAQEEVNGATSELTNEESEASRDAAPVDVAPTAIVDEPADAVKNSGNASAAAEPLPAQTDEAGLATESAQPGEDFWPTSSKKGKKKRQKQQHQELSGEQDAEAMTAPGEPEIIATSNTEKEIATAELAEADKASQNDSNKGETLALGASAAAVAVEVAALAADEALPGKTAGEPVSEKAIEPEPEADNEWAVPSSAKKKSKKEKRKSKAVELDAQQDPAPDVVPANAPTEVPVVGDTKALTASVIEPAAEETPTLSRKQSKKDKKRKKQSLAFEDEAPRETETYDFVETPVAGLETSPAASDPAGETTYQADQVAAEEVPPSTETPDDSFHDAENFVETPTLVDSWHDAEDNALLTGVPSPPEPTPTTETFDFAKSAEDKEAAAATLAEQIHPVTAPTESTSLDKQDDLATPVAELEDPSMSQRNNLVDDVFGIASDSGDFTITPEDKPADHEEIMPDRGVEFEPERASEDMGAFGDATPRDSAEWSLGSSKKSGKKGKKGRKSASKADLPFETASSVPLEAVVEQSASDVHSATAAEAEAPRPTVVAEQEVPAIDAKHEKQGSLGIEQETPAPEPDCVELPKQDANLVDEKQGSAELNVVEVIDENAGTKDLADPIESTTGDALDVVAPKSSDPPKDELVQDANDISWAPTTKKKKGKKGKATRETETSTPTIGIPEADPKTAIESHIEVEEPVDNLQAAQVDHSGRAIADDTGNQITTTPAAPDAIDDFTWAPTSKRDKKKAKKLNKSGSQTPQNVEECSKATQSPAEQLDDVAAALVAVSEPAGSPHEPKSPEGQADQEEVSAESSRDLAVSPLPANNAGVEARAGESSAAAQRVDNVNDLTPEAAPLVEHDSSEVVTTAETVLDEWVPTSKKSRKGKKKQAVVDDLGSIEDKSGVDPERPDEAATDTPSMTTGLAVGGATIAAGLLASSMSHEADRKEEKETTTEEPADDVAWNSGSKKKGKKAKRASKVASEAMPVETEEKQTEEIVEAPLPTEETIDDTTNVEPISREDVPERTAGESKEFDHEVSAEATNAVIVGLETQPAADDADDLRASTPSTKKKKSKKAKRSDVDAVTESREESKIDVADEKLDAAAPEERTNGATDQAVASEVTALDGIASSEQKAVTSSDDIPVSRSVEEDAQTEAADGQDVAAMADNAQAETTAEAPPAQDDDFATFASSKKRKGKKARKTDIWAEEEPAVDSTPSASLGATDTLKEGPAKSQPEGEATPVAELDDGQNATTELPDAAISDDFATSSTSKKKKGKKGRKADLWEFEERSTKPDLPASSKSIGDMPSEHQQVTAADAPVEERAKSHPQPVATAITDLDQEQKDIAELLDAKEDEIAGFATSKKKKGKKGRKADIWASEEKNIGTDVPESAKTIEKMPSEEQVAPADLPTENVSANEVPVENIASVPAATEETALDEDMHASHGATAPKESSANDILIEELPHVAAATEDLALGENKPASAEIPAAEEGDLANVTGTNRKKGEKSRKSGLFEDDVQTEPEASIPSDALEQSEEQQRTTETISAEQQESAESRPTEPTEDPWAVSTSSKKKKGKKGEQSGSATPAVDVAELEASQLAETSKPVEEQHISAEIAAAEQDQSGESKPVETTEDTWALPASSKKKKGKKGRQSGSITPAVDVADQPREILSEEAMTGMPDVDAGVEVKPDAMSSPQPEETHVQVPGSTGLPSGAIPSLEGDTAAQNPTTDLDDMSKDFQETPLTEPAVAGPTEETTTLPDDNVRDQPAAPETDDWWSPQTSKKQKKKGKKSKSADVEAFAGPFPGLDVPGKPAPEEPNTEQASQGANDGQAIPIDEAAVRDAEITQDTPATENDDWLSMPMGKSGKKGKAKKGKRATQVSLDEQPSEKLEESRVDKDSDQSEAGLAREVGAADAVETPVLATASTDSTATLTAGLAPDVTLGDRTIPSTSAGPVKAADSPAPPASTPLGEEAAQLAVAENVPADEAVAQAEAALDTSAPETDDFSSFPTSKNKAKKGRKEKLAVSEAPLEVQEASTEVEELQVEETVSQSTATTLQGAAEAETEDAWALPVNGKKGKKSKKLQQVVAKNSEPDGQIDNQESRAEPEMSTAGKNIANEADAEDFWSAPATGKKAKKQKKARREAELMELEDEPRATSSIELGDTSNGKHEAGPIDSAEALREVDVKSEPIESTPDAPITAEEDNEKLEAMEGDKSVTAEQFDNAAAKEPANGQREDDDVGVAAVGASAAIAATARSMDPGSEATTTDVQDWSSFSTKRSKRDKKKAKKTDPVTPQANEPAPASAEADEVVDATADAVSVDVESIQQGSSADTLTRSADFADDQSRTLTEAIVPTSVEDVAVASQDLHHAQTTDPAAPLTQATDLAQSSSAADIDFTATVAAGLADSGFDPNLVINDPVFQRRASPTGSPEANPEEYVFAPAVSRRKTKGKRGKDSSDLTGTEVPEASRTVSSDEKRSSDVDEIVNKTLASTGFDASLLEKALEASNEQSKEQSGGDDEFALATTKRRKNKKSKRSTVEQSEESSGVPTSVEAILADLDVQQSEQTAGSKVVEDTTTAEPKGPMEGSENGWMVQDEMDVDAMDKAYKAYKKNKRQQKKLKAKSAATSDNQESSAVEDTERSAPMSEVEDMSKRQAIRAGFEEQNDQPASALQPTEVQSPSSATSAKSLVESVFPGLERIKRRVPTRDAGADDGRSAREGEVDARSRALIHTSEVSQHLPTEVPRTPTPSGHAHDSKAGVLGPSGVAAGLAVAGAGLANARQAHGHADEHAASNRAMDTTEPSWSFAALGNEERSGASPTNDIRHDVIRDSGYETAKRTSQQTDRSSQEVPQIVRTSSSRDSLLQRRSLEPLRVSTPTSPDWEIHTPKQRRGKDSAREVPMHERTPSDKTPLEPTSKNRASYLFQTPPDPSAEAAPSPSPLHDQPSPSHRSGRHSTAQSATVPAEPSPALGSGGHRDRSALSPTSPRTHLDAIPEEHGHRRHPSKRSKSGAEIGGPEHVKAIKRTETPPRMRAQEQAITPQQHTQSTSAGKRSVSTPLSTSDEVFNRLPWPAVDQENDTVHLTRSHPRHSHATPDHRSASVLSDRSNASGNHFKAPQELRSYSRNSNGSSTPSLRRTSLSGDLRAASRRGGSDVGSLSGSLTGSAGGARASPHTISFEPPPTPPLEHDEPVNGSATRAMDTTDAVFQGYGDAQRSQVSPTRPPSVRKRQSMHINELESRLDLLTAENRALQEARQASETTRGFDGGSLQEALEARDLQLQAKDVEINQIRAMLLPLQEEIARLTELSNGLTEANRNLVDDTNGRYATLQAEHAEAHHKWQETVRELDSVRHEHGRVTSGMHDIVEAEIATALADKNAEILRLREQLDIAAEQIRALQVQIQSSTSTDFLVQRDEDYFDGACQKLCQHVQQWVLRFSKTSDNRICRLSTDLKDDKIEARLDNAVLDGSDVDKLLGDRVRRRDVFMSVVMTMVWEYVFTRYLFGMDREQRQKLKALEKLLAEVGPPRAVAHWRATTLTLLSKRPQFDEQCALDTEAVAHEIFEALCMLLPPPSVSRDQLQASLQKVLRIAVDLAIEMRTQRAEYIMLPPLQPEYDTNGDLVRKVYFNASLMNERSGLFSSNEELAARQAVVKIVLFPLVVKKGDDVGEGDDEIVVCPAQVLVHNDGGRDRKIVRVMSGAMEIDEPIRSRQSMRSLVSEAPGGAGF